MHVYTYLGLTFHIVAYMSYYNKNHHHNILVDVPKDMSAEMHAILPRFLPLPEMIGL